MPTYDELFVKALEALKAEDKLLRNQFAAATEQHPGAYGDVAHGLAYWLFETTLVYTLFKAWLPVVPVVWEYTTGKPPLDAIHAKGSQQKCDLVIFDGWPQKDIRAAFEAKWWNSGGKKASDAILEDADKLRRNFPKKDRFLLTFWWNEYGNFADDLRTTREFCTGKGLEVVEGMDNLWFKTSLLGGGDGYFALGPIRVL